MEGRVFVGWVARVHDAEGEGVGGLAGGWEGLGGCAAGWGWGWGCGWGGFVLDGVGVSRQGEGEEGCEDGGAHFGC